MSHLYILADDGKTPIPVEDVLVWARWYEQADKERRVGYDTIGDTEVSTIFLGIEHNFGIKGRPILWETMIFGGPLDHEMGRYTSYDEALAGHEHWVELAKRSAHDRSRQVR